MKNKCNTSVKCEKCGRKINENNFLLVIYTPISTGHYALCGDCMLKLEEWFGWMDKEEKTNKRTNEK